MECEAWWHYDTGRHQAQFPESAGPAGQATGGGQHAGLSLYVVTPTNPDNSNVLPVEWRGGRRSRFRRKLYETLVPVQN